MHVPYRKRLPQKALLSFIAIFNFDITSFLQAVSFYTWLEAAFVQQGPLYSRAT